MVLGIGYRPGEYEIVRREWQGHNVDFRFVHSTEEAMRWLRQEEYVCITILADRLEDVRLDILHKVKPIPVVLLSENCSVTQRKAIVQKGITDIILNASQLSDARSSGTNAVQYYLDLPEKGERQVTAVTTEDLFFCLEYRTVEVRGRSIDLTPKEFDILALLITHPKQVFTFEMAVELVWGDAYTDDSRHILWNHVSRLRQKMKVEPDVPVYVKNVRGIGYKYDPVWPIGK
jgi:DNA-binding response OmpR family regulator